MVGMIHPYCENISVDRSVDLDWIGLDWMQGLKFLSSASDWH